MKLYAWIAWQTELHQGIQQERATDADQPGAALQGEIPQQRATDADQAAEAQEAGEAPGPDAGTCDCAPCKQRLLKLQKALEEAKTKASSLAETQGRAAGPEAQREFEAERQKQEKRAALLERQIQQCGCIREFVEQTPAQEFSDAVTKVTEGGVARAHPVFGYETAEGFRTADGLLPMKTSKGERLVHVLQAHELDVHPGPAQTEPEAEPGRSPADGIREVLRKLPSSAEKVKQALERACEAIESQKVVTSVEDQEAVRVSLLDAMDQIRRLIRAAQGTARSRSRSPRREVAREAWHVVCREDEKSSCGFVVLRDVWSLPLPVDCGA